MWSGIRGVMLLLQDLVQLRVVVIRFREWDGALSELNCMTEVNLWETCPVGFIGVFPQRDCRKHGVLADEGFASLVDIVLYWEYKCLRQCIRCRDCDIVVVF